MDCISERWQQPKHDVTEYLYFLSFQTQQKVNTTKEATQQQNCTFVFDTTAVNEIMRHGGSKLTLNVDFQKCFDCVLLSV